MTKPLTVGSLFAGIGGFDLAARWMGWRTIWVSEIEPFACRVLAHHFPDAPNLGDITKIDWRTVERPDILCGGFPCQDVSVAGRQAGIHIGTRSGLYYEFVRAIRDLRPRYVVVENVGALLVRGMDVVLGELSEVGYDAEWSVVSACAVGAPHMRERVFILAYPNSNGWVRRIERGNDGTERTGNGEKIGGEDRFGPQMGSPSYPRLVSPWGTTELPAPLVVDGIPDIVDRLHAIGNAIVPQCAVEGPFRRIRELEEIGLSPLDTAPIPW